MRRIVFLCAAVGLGLSANSFGQGGGGGGQGFGGGGGGGQGFGGGGSSFGGGGSSFGGGGSSFSGGGSSFSGGGNTFSGGGNTFSGGGMSFTGTPTSTGTGRTGAGGRAIGGTGVSISPTNFLAATYGNPLYNGRPGSTNISPKAGGGFGQPSYGNVTTTGTTTPGGRTGLGGTASINRGGLTGGVGGLNGGYGEVAPITFTAQVRFNSPPVVAAQVQTDLQNLISRTTITNPSEVRVEVVGSTAILRGRVASDDERRLVEGIVRLEPGIHDVKNELTIP